MSECVTEICRLQIRADKQLTMAIDDDRQFYHHKSGKEEWIRNDMSGDWEDIINCKGQFCPIDVHGKTLLLNSEELFLIELYDDQPKIYRLNMEEKVWIQVESLDDRIFFIASDCSFSQSAQEFPRGKGNCGEEGNRYDRRFRICGPSVEVYDLEIGSYGSITSFIFWPTPKWLKDPSLLTLI
ncbi:hypothetical protein R3W88_006197 [Solanum pinnatisectum]|uniref:KIB1-4 beta-propeller domain-containing protein n=1 Tax=Solanum pinnatisectum TaxID=50273 RepID=A0AAV9KEB2_9SOLN|nr:hypothetical protein R3W88_006197 [Solanum pinnatisectum]